MKKYLILFLVISAVIACKSKTENAINYMNEGLTKLSKSDNRGAITDFTKALSADPNNSEIYFHRACCYFNIKDTAKSMLDFNKAIELNPKYADAYYNRALLKQYLNDQEGTCADWKMALKLGKANIKDSFDYCK